MVPSTRQNPLVFSSSVRVVPEELEDEELDDDELDEEALEDDELDDEALEELLLSPGGSVPPHEVSPRATAHKNNERFTMPPNCTWLAQKFGHRTLLFNFRSAEHKQSDLPVDILTLFCALMGLNIMKPNQHIGRSATG